MQTSISSLDHSDPISYQLNTVKIPMPSPSSTVTGKAASHTIPCLSPSSAPESKAKQTNKTRSFGFPKHWELVQFHISHQFPNGLMGPFTYLIVPFPIFSFLVCTSSFNTPQRVGQMESWVMCVADMSRTTRSFPWSNLGKQQSLSLVTMLTVCAESIHHNFLLLNVYSPRLLPFRDLPLKLANSSSLCTHDKCAGFLH